MVVVRVHLTDFENELLFIRSFSEFTGYTLDRSFCMLVGELLSLLRVFFLFFQSLEALKEQLEKEARVPEGIWFICPECQASFQEGSSTLSLNQSSHSHCHQVSSC